MPNNQQQIVLGGDRPFTFDYVYPPTVDQKQVYSTCVIPLLNKFMEGYVSQNMNNKSAKLMSHIIEYTIGTIQRY